MSAHYRCIHCDRSVLEGVAPHAPGCPHSFTKGDGSPMYNIEAQENMVTALWRFAEQVIQAGNYGAFTDKTTVKVDPKYFGSDEVTRHNVPLSAEQSSAIGVAMDCIAAGYGFVIAEIQ